MFQGFDLYFQASGFHFQKAQEHISPVRFWDIASLFVLLSESRFPQKIKGVFTENCSKVSLTNSGWVPLCMLLRTDPDW